MTKTCIIVVTYNGDQWIQRCLQSGHIAESDVIVIDNGSTDNTLGIIRDKFPQTHLIQSGENLGFGKANNIGINYALKNKYEYILLLNQDAWIESNWIPECITMMEQLDLSLISPVQLSAEKQIDAKFSEHITRYSRGKDFARIKDKSTMPAYTTFFNAACWLVKSDAFRQIGMFNPIFPHYGEDNEFLNRMTYSHLKYAILPKYEVIHDRHYRVEPSSFSYLSNRAYVSSLKILTNINMSRFNSVRLFLQTSTRDSLHSMLLFKFTKSFATMYACLKALFNIKHILGSRIFPNSNAI